MVGVFFRYCDAKLKIHCTQNIMNWWEKWDHTVLDTRKNEVCHSSTFSIDPMHTRATKKSNSDLAKKKNKTIYWFACKKQISFRKKYRMTKWYWWDEMTPQRCGSSSTNRIHVRLSSTMRKFFSITKFMKIKLWNRNEKKNSTCQVEYIPCIKRLWK